MAGANKVTIHDVAKKAGVSISSVSRALGTHPHVSDTLRRRVESAADELGYQPDFLGHSLRSRNTHSVGFLVGSISNPVVADISSSASDVLSAHGYAMLLVCSQNRPEADVEYLRFLARRQVSGLIVSSAANEPEQARVLVDELRIPAVMLDRYRLDSHHASAVLSDHAGGMEAAVKHLVEQGHLHIALIGGREDFDPAQERLHGFRRALEAASVAPDPALICSWGMSADAGYTATRELLALPTPPTALIAGGNLILAGVLQALKEFAVTVGREVAVIGCDDTELTRLHEPPITVIARDLAMLGTSAANLLIETIATGIGRDISLPVKLTIRQSSSLPYRRFDGRRQSSATPT